MDMSDKPENPYAFPVAIDYREQGMDLRDYFAAHASPLVVAHFVDSYLKAAKTNEPEQWAVPIHSEWHCRKAAMIEARYRYALADLMLAARAKGGAA
jgi:hypothetical protein